MPHIEATGAATDAHNGFLNTATELGVPAAMLLAVYFVGTFAQALRFHERRPSAFSLFLLAFLLAFAIMNLTESRLLQIHSVFWILFVAVAVMVERSAEPVS